VVSLAEVLRQHWPQYERQFGSAILPSHRRAVQAILQCRTAALGGEVYRCADCRRDHFVYHSCNHRACPQCGQADAAEWTDRQKLKLLPVPYYLITFTVPEALRAWLRSHQKHGYALLLRESAATLQEVAGRQKYLGAELGVLSVLHTWGRQLQFHPHVHCVVPAAGLRADGLRWCRPPSPEFFLPQIVLAARFRNRLRAALQQLPDSSTIPAFVWRQKWVVDVQSVGSGQTAIKYLAAYVCHTALGSQRIVKADNGQITFKYKDSHDQQWRTLTLAASEFLRRFLQHVLPKGFQRIRYFGWLSPAAKTRWQRILALLDWKAPLLPASPLRPPLTCPCCHKPLALIGHLARPPPRRCH
jgi:Putative transposase/Transposase zinc-binding domain